MMKKKRWLRVRQAKIPPRASLCLPLRRWGNLTLFATHTRFVILKSAEQELRCRHENGRANNEIFSMILGHSPERTYPGDGLYMADEAFGAAQMRNVAAVLSEEAARPVDPGVNERTAREERPNTEAPAVEADLVFVASTKSEIRMIDGLLQKWFESNSHRGPHTAILSVFGEMVETSVPLVDFNALAAFPANTQMTWNTFRALPKMDPARPSFTWQLEPKPQRGWDS